MRACRYRSSSFIVFDSVDVDLGESQAATNFFCDAFDLNLVPLLRRALIRDVDVDAGTGLLAQVMRCYGQAAGPFAHEL